MSDRILLLRSISKIKINGYGVIAASLLRSEPICL